MNDKHILVIGHVVRQNSWYPANCSEWRLWSKVTNIWPGTPHLTYKQEVPSMPTIPISMARRYLMGNRVTLRFRTCSRWIVQPREENSTTFWDHAWRHGASMDLYMCADICLFWSRFHLWLDPILTPDTASDWRSSNYRHACTPLIAVSSSISL